MCQVAKLADHDRIASLIRSREGVGATNDWGNNWGQYLDDLEENLQDDADSDSDDDNFKVHEVFNDSIRAMLAFLKKHECLDKECAEIREALEAPDTPPASPRKLTRGSGRIADEAWTTIDDEENLLDLSIGGDQSPGRVGA